MVPQRCPGGPGGLLQGLGWMPGGPGCSRAVLTAEEQAQRAQDMV